MSAPAAVTQHYTQLAEQLEALAEASAQGDLERMQTLQSAHEATLQRIQRTPTATPSPQLATLIRRALDAIGAAAPHIERLQRDAQEEMAGARNQRKVSQSYR
ncbi:MAG: hypothetical protein KDE68_13310 [Rhodocyclaceae bacterium]|nr:hypothetical protein [Rhodocyclaceae bacterium]